MTKNTNTSMRRFAAKCLWIWGMAMAFVASAEAENKATIDNFNIKVGEEKTISVYLENSDPMVGLQMDFKLPKGLDFVTNSVQRDEVRLSRSSHSIYMNEVQSSMDDMAKGIKTVRLLIQPNGIYNIAGDRGAVAYFKVKANENMVETSEIVLDNIVGSSSEFDEETGNIKGYHLESYTAHVSPNVGFFYLTEDSICVKNDGSVKKVSLGLRNYTSVRGMEAVLSLPEGLSLDTEANGAPKFEYGERLPQNLSISSSILEDGRTKLVLSGLTSDTLKGDTGVVFSFFVKASETFQEVAELSLDEIILSDNAGHGINMEGKLVMEVINSFIAYYTPANDSIQGLRTRYEAAVEKINTAAADVKDSAVVVNAVQEVATRIEDLRKSVDEAYANETLPVIYDEVLAPVVSIDTAIVKMVDDALALQAAKVANDEAFVRLTEEIGALQAKLDAAKTTIETDYAEVAGQFTADIAALPENIDSISNEVKGLYEEVKLTAESQIDATAIEAGIEKVLADAEEAHKGSSIYGVKNANGAELTGIYTVDGRRVAEPVKGQVNIFKYSDGTVKKFYMK